MKTIEEYQKFLGSQKIYVKEKPTTTIDPHKEGIKWSLEPKAGYIEFKPNINGLILKEYLNQMVRIYVVLKNSIIDEKSWNSNINPDRGGHNQSLELKFLKFIDLKDDPNEKTYRKLVEFTFYLITFITQGVESKVSFSGNEEIGMDLFKKHIAIQNACWYPAVGIRTCMRSIIDWLIKYEEEHSQILNLFNPTLVLGTGTIKPQINAETGEYSAFGFKRMKVISRNKIRELVGYDICCVGDDAFILSDGRLYVNIYHPSASKFSPMKIARGVAILYNLHKEGKL